MITNKEISAVELSPTKKDFYQIWNELLEVAGNLSERWDPSSTNESDPGIVLLKVLTAVADKLNYTIDANTLEAFMPSAAQEESMKKLCDMLGYDMKYLQSATTDVKISYNESGHDPLDTIVRIDRFTNIKDIDGTINYITLEDVYLNADNTSKTVPCMEGELVECETADDNSVSILHLDDNKRYYLPETQIAENGIFITNINDGTESAYWDRVNNLNTQNIKTKCFKFGFDSREFLPYIQFPEDISTIIEDGLKIRYVRTTGASGNISVKTLCKMEPCVSWSQFTDTSTSASEGKDYHNAENYTVYNISAATTGKNAESINEAYENYKKTVGTFDTLVTCRDYMNKIYQLTTNDSEMSNLVSNVIVSDIRDDINKAMTMCTFTERGIEYKTMAKPVDLSSAIGITQSSLNSIQLNVKDESVEVAEGEEKPYVGESYLGKLYKVIDASENILYYVRCIFDGNEYKFIKVNTDPITHFDLVIYPFNPVYGLNSKQEYINSFKYSTQNLKEIQQALEENKTLSHNFVSPEPHEIACIKNYYGLSAKVTTTRKVSTMEQADILGKIYSKVYENFNLRKLEFGEEIPYDKILEVMESADSRIKYVKLEDPVISTKVCLAGGAEYSFSSKDDITTDTQNLSIGDTYYNQLVLNNVLAGRVPLFEYDTDFKADFADINYPDSTYKLTYPENYPTNISEIKNYTGGIAKIETEFKVDTTKVNNLKLTDNEVIQFRLPNFATEKTYPAYVNFYFFKNDKANYISAIPATMWSITDFLDHNFKIGEKSGAEALIFNELSTSKQAWNFPSKFIEVIEDEAKLTENYLTKVLTYNSSTGLFVADSGDADTLCRVEKIRTTTQTDDETEEEIKKVQYATVDNTETWHDINSTTDIFYSLKFENTAEDFTAWRRWLLSVNVYAADPVTAGEERKIVTDESSNPKRLANIYKKASTDFTKTPGKLVSTNNEYFKPIELWNSISTNPFDYYLVPKMWKETVRPNGTDELGHTQDGLGQTSNITGIPANTEYKLSPSDYLCINYTNSSSEGGEEIKTKINEFFSGSDKTPIIIKPNFELIDSQKWKEAGHDFNKKDGFSFEAHGKTLDGMFTLGSDQQIEIRKPKIVDLDTVATYVYWERSVETPDSHGRIIFEFDEDRDSVSGKYLSYTLKEGEYFYFTDKNKTDLAYYGSGTKITRTVNTPEIFKYSTDNTVSAEDISTRGITAAIPWRAYDFSKSGTIDKKLTFTEYQYINLTKDDILCKIALSNTNTILNNNWQPVNLDETSYKLSNSSGESHLSNVQIDTMAWEVRSKLEVNIGPNTSQILNKHVDSNKEVVATDQIKLVSFESGSTKEYDTENAITLEATATEADATYIPLTLKANKNYQASVNSLDVTTKELNEEGKIVNVSTDFRIRVTQSKDLLTSSGQTLNLNNFGEGTHTKINFDSVTTEDIDKPYITLNTLIPEGKYGLLMMYNNKQDSNGKGVALKFNTDCLTLEVKSKRVWKVWYNDDNWAPTRVEYLESDSQNTPVKELYEDSQGRKWVYIDNRWTGITASSLETLDEYSFIDSDIFYYCDISFKGESLGTFVLDIKSDELTLEDTLNELISKLLSIESNGDVYIDDKPFWIGDPKTTEGVKILNLLDYFEKSNFQPRISIFNKNNWWTNEDSNNINGKKIISNSQVVLSVKPSKNDPLNITITYSTIPIYYLRKGLNIIKIPESGSIEIWPGYTGEGDSKTVSDDTLIIGNLDIIDGINSKLCYKTSANANGADLESQILADIRKLDPTHDFYYNNIVLASSIIDMNDADPEDNLEYISNWYDANNINSKFVVSEIDAEYLLKHVTVAKASRGNY